MSRPGVSGRSGGSSSEESRAAALHGATRAFLSRSPSPASAGSEGRARGDAGVGAGGGGGHYGGALAAASRATTRARSPAAPAPAVASLTGTTSTSTSTATARWTSPTRSIPIAATAMAASNDPSLTAGRSAVARAIATAKAPHVVEDHGRSREQSPSHIAATLAAARAPPPSSLPPSPHAAEFFRPPTSPERFLDEEADRRGDLLTTRQLIRSFEAKDKAPDAGLAPPSPGSRTRSPPRAIISPVPLRPSIPLLASRRAAESFKPPTETKGSPPAPPKKPSALIRRTTRQSESESAKEESRERSPGSPRRNQETEVFEDRGGSRGPGPQSILDAVVDSDVSSEDSYASAQDRLSRSSTRKGEPSMKKPQPAPPRLEPLKTAISPSSRPLPPRRPLSAVVYSIPNAPPLKPQLTADSLADAMVASSLAGSRVASPMRTALATPPPPRPWSSHGRRSSRGLLQVSSNNSYNTYNYTNSSNLNLSSGSGAMLSRTPSPFKAMRHTLRGEPSLAPGASGGGVGGGDGSGLGPIGAFGGEEPAYKPPHHHHRHRLVRKHPHKHAEGDRRRWRDVVAEAERRRYEGVWAANRGLLLPTDAADAVHAYVVRDIWLRSGLGGATLAQVWDLVADRGGGGGGSGDRSAQPTPTSPADDNKARQLLRDEFVVGLWLVDQSLKGRRLPVEVGDSVWASVRGLMPGLRGR